MSHTMRAAVVRAHGGPEVLRIEEVPVPPVAGGQVRVRVRSVALNFRDVHNRRGSAADSSVPFVPGSDLAGDVVEVAPDVAHLREGDRVLGVSMDGAYSEQIIASAAQLFPLPSGVDYDTGAILPVAGLTASFLVSSSGARDGMTVATWAAAGGLGCFLGGLLRASGVRTIGITSSDEKTAVAASAGHVDLVNHRAVDVVQAVGELTGGAGVDIVVDSVGGPDFIRSFQMTRDEGIVVLCGRSGGEPELDKVQHELIGSRRALALREFHLNGYIMRHFDELPRRLQALMDALADGHIAVPITVYSLDDAAAAHELMESGASTGKLVLRP